MYRFSWSSAAVTLAAHAVVMLPVMEAEVQAGPGVCRLKVDNPPCRLPLLVDVDVSFIAHTCRLNLHVPRPSRVLHQACFQSQKLKHSETCAHYDCETKKLLF